MTRTSNTRGLIRSAGFFLAALVSLGLLESPGEAACNLSSTTPVTYAPAGGSGTFVLTGTSCGTWTAVSSNTSWLHVTPPATKTGAATVNYTVDAYTGTTTRTATITGSGKVLTVKQTGITCTFTLTPTSATVSPVGGSGSFALTVTNQACTWSASSNQTWLTVAPASGTGDGTLTYTATANTGTTTRTATITVGARTFLVTQGTCGFTLSPSAVTVSSAASTTGAFFWVTAADQTCPWTAVSTAGWLTVHSGSSGTGTGAVEYWVSENNTGATRTGTITAAGLTFTVTQTACQYNLTPTSALFPSAGGSGTFLVNASSATCAWTATSNNAWLHVTVGASGTGYGKVGYTVDPSTTSARTGTITVAGQTFTVTQSCVTITPASVSIPSALTTGTITVVASVSNCAWTAVSNNTSWLTVTSGASGTWNGSVVWRATANTGVLRTGTITVGGLTFTVTQASPSTTTDEGYDPLRQITAQVMKANLLILQDVTGSMAWYPDYGLSVDSNTFAYPTYGDDSRGHLFWSTDSSGAGTAWPGFSGKTFPASCSPTGTPTCVSVPSVASIGAANSTDPSSSCTSSPCRFWYYVLTYEGPSRMATVKNALGNSIDVVAATATVPAYTPPLLQSGLTNTTWKNAVSTATITITPVPKDINQTKTGSVSAWLYTFDYGTSGTTNRVGPAPGVPFSPFDSSSHFPLISNGTCSVGTCNYLLPKDIVGNYKNRINWGLTTFSTSSSTLVHIDMTGNNKDLALLEDYLYFSGSTRTGGTQPGLSASGGTNTINGFTVAASEIVYAADNDPKIDLRCNRPYGAILVTDGMSNTGNPSGKNWIMPCSNPLAGEAFCDTPAGSDDCPSNWANYAAKKADDLYSTTTARNFNRIPARTWTIGVSAAVGPCELDFIAYRGRTDAMSPNFDTGWSGYDATVNPYIPNPASAEPVDPRIAFSASQYDGPAGQFYWNKDTSINRGTADFTTLPDAQKFKNMIGTGKSHGHNAFFATSADDLATAFAAIVAATATGDYATSAPLSGAGAATSNIVVLPSTDYPSWKGHLYAYDSSVVVGNQGTCSAWLPECYGGVADNSQNPCIPCLKWDAGQLLTESTTPAANRKIYTWNPASSNALVEVLPANKTTLKTIDTGLASMTDAQINSIIDFIRGNDGSGAPRSWRLGPMINTTPALIGAPPKYTQGKVNQAHTQFQANQSARTPLMWVGASDGMLHAFRLADGIEQLALLPPYLLPAQRTLYDNYKNQGATVTGQPIDVTAHQYGVANSLRFSDVYFPADGTFKTVGFLTLGPGGPELTAIDLTHPTPSDSGYGFGGTDPVKILWRKTTTDLPGLGNTWSLPALAPVTSDSYRLLIGGGVKTANNMTAQTTGTGFVNPTYYVLNPVDGSVRSTLTMNSTTGSGSPLALVGNQAFADSVLLDTAAKYYQEDNLANLGLQADLNGRIWFASGGADFGTSGIGINATTSTGASGGSQNQQPIYYPPAASGYGQTAGCDVFAFASGTLYEKSTFVTGKDIGMTPNFEPSLYVATAPKPTTAGSAPVVPAANVIRKKINSLVAPSCPATPSSTDPPCYDNPDAGFNLSNSSQVTAAPFLLVSKDGTLPSKAFFLVYDPLSGCNGVSYVVELDVATNSSCAPTVADPIVYGIGVGAASGFTITDDKVRIAKSGLGVGQKATIATVPGVSPSSGGTGTAQPLWWRELK